MYTDNCTLLGFYAASGGNFLPTFWENLLVLSSGLKNLEPRGWDFIGCPETSVRNYQYLLHSNPEEHSPQLLCGRSLKSRILCVLVVTVTKAFRLWNILFNYRSVRIFRVSAPGLKEFYFSWLYMLISK